MNRIDRLTAILIHLQTKKIVKAQELADRFDISKRTVYRDIRALEEAGIPIGAEQGVGYYIVDTYHLPPVGFSKEEAGALLIANKLAEKLTDKSLRENLNAALYKIRSVLNVSEKDFIENIDNHIQVFSTSSIIKNNIPDKITETILQGIHQKKVIELTYRSFSKDEETCRQVEPIGICHYSFNWHLIAFCKLRNDYRDFRIDRIHNIKLTQNQFTIENKPSIQDYFKTFLSNDKVSMVKLLFNKNILQEINHARYYYGFIEEKIKNGKIEMTFLSNSHTYIGRWILTLQDNVEVIEPESLKKTVVEMVQKLQKKYLTS